MTLNVKNWLFIFLFLIIILLLNWSSRVSKITLFSRTRYWFLNNLLLSWLFLFLFQFCILHLNEPLGRRLIHTCILSTLARVPLELETLSRSWLLLIGIIVYCISVIPTIRLSLISLTGLSFWLPCLLLGYQTLLQLHLVIAHWSLPQMTLLLCRFIELRHRCANLSVWWGFLHLLLGGFVSVDIFWADYLDILD
jgi:hypothetical protein